MSPLFSNIAQRSQDAALAGVCTSGQPVKIQRPECSEFVKSASRTDRISVADFDAEHPEVDTVFSEEISNTVKAIRPRLTNPDVRQQLRKKKKSTDLSMRQIYILGENGFYSKPNSFISNVRWACHDNDSTQTLNHCRDIFDKFSMPEMAQIVKLVYDSHKDTDLWMGFKRMRPFDAAVILAQLHSFSWHDLLYIIVSIQKIPDIFTNYQTTAQVLPANTEVSKSFLKIPGQKSRNFDYLHMAYRPRMYPLHEFEHVPFTAAKLIDSCESMVELNGKPGFDYYWVLVPSVSLQHPMTCHPDGVYRIKIDGKVVESKCENDVSIALDKFLVSEKIIAPCILGERDGKCYFVGMWS